MNVQMTIFQMMNKPVEKNTEAEMETPELTGRIFQIPDDVWQNRCKICHHKLADENRPCDMRMIEKPMYEKFLPCRILRLTNFDTPGECSCFSIKDDTPGYCVSCEHNNIFCDGYCMKKDHAPQRQLIMKGDTYGHHNEYWGKHILSVCDDYKEKWRANHGVAQADKKDNAARGNTDPALAGLRT